MKKITLIGIGNVGICAAKALYRSGTSEIVLFDIQKDWAEGIALDIANSAHLLHSASTIKGTSKLADIALSDIVVISAGSPRKSGMSRMDLFEQNKGIVDAIGAAIQKYTPKAITVLVTNPVDHLTHFMRNLYPDLNIFGFGCSLDTVRYRSYIGETLGISPSTIQGLIIGTHNQDMIPFIEGTSVGGIPVQELLNDTQIETVLQKTINAGNDIVQLLKTTGSSYTAGEIISRQVSAIIHHSSEIFSVDVPLQGEMGFHDITLSLPAVINSSGVQTVLQIPKNTKTFSLLKNLAERIADTFRI